MEILLLLVIFLPIVLSILGYFLSNKFEKIREIYFILLGLIELIVFSIIAILNINSELEVNVPLVVGFGLNFKVDLFRCLYTIISIFMWFMTTIFSRDYMLHHHKKSRYYLFSFITLSGVLGVFLSNDLYTTFCFFELMSFASYPLVIHEETEDALKAGETYLAVAVIGGMIMLVGMFLINFEVCSLSFESLREYYISHDKTIFTYIGGILILLGFGAKAGMYPLHIWLPKAHPVAPAPASALLSGILTKTGVFGIIVLCADVFFANFQFAYILLTLAVITMFLGALLALFSIDLKRTLACSSMSQIGFILLGLSFMVLLGGDGGLANTGSLLHMVNHSLIKLVLFMCAGVVFMNTHSLNLNDVRGFGRKKPFLMIIFLIGALGIMGVPLFNGYVSKTMIHESIVEFINIYSGNTLIFKIIEWIFLISGGLTVAYMTKLFICIFVEKNTDEEKQRKMDENKKYMLFESKIVFALSASLLLFIGLFPNLVTRYVISPTNEFFGVEMLEHIPHFFSFECLKGGFISIAIGAIIYFTLVRHYFIKDNKYVNNWNNTIDLENLVYRPVLINGNLLLINNIIKPIANCVEIVLTDGTILFIKYVVRPIAYFTEYILVDGTILFTLYFVRFLALVFDGFIVFLNKTILKPHVYQFKEVKLGDRISNIIGKFTKKKDEKYSSNVINNTILEIEENIHKGYNSYSFAFAMISLGIIIVLVFVFIYI